MNKLSNTFYTKTSFYLATVVLSRPAATPPSMWDVGCVGYVSTIDKPIGNGDRELLDKVTTIYTHNYEHGKAAEQTCEAVSGMQSEFVIVEVVRGSGYLKRFMLNL